MQHLTRRFAGPALALLDDVPCRTASCKTFLLVPEPYTETSTHQSPVTSIGAFFVVPFTVCTKNLPVFERLLKSLFISVVSLPTSVFSFILSISSSYFESNSLSRFVSLLSKLITLLFNSLVNLAEAAFSSSESVKLVANAAIHAPSLYIYDLLSESKYIL